MRFHVVILSILHESLYGSYMDPYVDLMPVTSMRFHGSPPEERLQALPWSLPMIPVLPWIPVCSKPEVGMSVPTSGASSHTPCTPTRGSMLRPRANHCFTFRPLTRLHPAWARRIVMTCKSHTDRLTRVHRKLLCSEQSTIATVFLYKLITCFSVQIDHHPCMATQDL